MTSNVAVIIEKYGVDYKLGETVDIEVPWKDEPIKHVLEVGQYVILQAQTLKVYDVAENWETAESMAMEYNEDSAGYIAIQITPKGQEVQEHWRELVADCYGWPY